MAGTGTFEIREGGSVVSTGIVVSLDEDSEGYTQPDVGKCELTSADIYKELRLRGYDYGPSYQGILAADITGAQLGFLKAKFFLFYQNMIITL